MLHEVEVRYPRLQKLIYSLIIAAKWLRPYFQAHSIVVITDQLLKAVLMSPDTFGRVAKWAVRLGEIDISFRPRSTLKAQVIADFIAECTWSITPMIGHTVDGGHEDDVPTTSAIEEISPIWTSYVDGSSNSSDCGMGLLLANLGGLTLEYALRFSFLASNNQAEYEDLLAGLRAADSLGMK